MPATIAALSRFPVKSMLGESPPSVDIDASGIVGDRAWGVVDVETGKVASAKHPGLWQRLLGVRASYADQPGKGRPLRIDLGAGEVVDGGDPAVHNRLSELVGREVRLVDEVPSGAVYDEEWPAVDGLAPAEFIATTRTGRSPVTGQDLSSLPVGMLAPGTFQDVSPLTLMTTASLRAAATLHPAGDWDPRRFRSTVLIDVDGEGFVEQGWVGRRLRFGGVEVDVMAPTPRCAMVTLAQQDLPDDGDVLRTLAQHNRLDVLGTGRYACLGVYASVVTPGTVAVGDPVEIPAAG